MRFTVADVFAGCGGLSHGFVRTGLFDVVLGTDIDERALDTFVHNHSKHGSNPVTVSGDIRSLPPSALAGKLNVFGLDHPGSLDILVGGPPCEGFSQNRRHEVILPGGKRTFTRNPLDNDDARNDLFRYFLALVDILRPRMVLIENVPQMVSSRKGATVQEIQRTLALIGYHTEWRILLASDYGVPQIRRRAFVVAWQDSIDGFRWPEPTHGKEKPGVKSRLRPINTVKDAIADLPPAAKAEAGRGGVSRYRKTRSAYAKAMQSNIATPMNHVARTPGEMVLKRLRAMRPGMITSDLPPELLPKSHYYNCYGRLSWDAPAKTITKSCNYLGSGCFGHPEEDRGITMREAARLQSFDDDFDFLSGSEPHVAKMVGSAVPPLLAAALAEQIAKALDT
ncbi:DNA (cytosine-5)-methyltransferase 1 [Mycolicibacterium rutilum]|uniref:Cytosine-specific methyltransferase n=1 Tax=Mycolicibacterium rutilum TaxID=370526 RepID=A0A1H6IH17_MYCRU|nr:DNA cytosine methyltransferase [Mycolicibacterium rutilum]SEH47807.1 DNA (cytosine-5)-methyltransferase 1 [Mycolicibacterium rutilum]